MGQQPVIYQSVCYPSLPTVEELFLDKEQRRVEG